MGGFNMITKQDIWAIKRFFFYLRRFLRYGFFRYLFMVSEEKFQLKTLEGIQTGEKNREHIMDILFVPHIKWLRKLYWLPFEFVFKKFDGKHINKMVIK